MHQTTPRRFKQPIRSSLTVPLSFVRKRKYIPSNLWKAESIEGDWYTETPKAKQISDTRWLTKVSTCVFPIITKPPRSWDGSPGSFNVSKSIEDDFEELTITEDSSDWGWGESGLDFTESIDGDSQEPDTTADADACASECGNQYTGLNERASSIPESSLQGDEAAEADEAGPTTNTTEKSSNTNLTQRHTGKEGDNVPDDDKGPEGRQEREDLI